MGRPIRGFVVALIGFFWIMRGFGLLLGGTSNNDDEQERISRMNDDETSSIPQSLILNDKIKREERRKSSVRIGSGINDDKSSLEIGEALDSQEEEMPITWDRETGERILNEDTSLEVKQAEEDLARAQEALHKAKLKESRSGLR